MTQKRFDYEDEYITLDGGVFAGVRTVNDAELISKTFNQLIEENEQLKKELDQFYLLIGRGDWSGLVNLIKGDVE